MSGDHSEHLHWGIFGMLNSDLQSLNPIGQLSRGNHLKMNAEVLRGQFSDTRIEIC